MRSESVVFGVLQLIDQATHFAIAEACQEIVAFMCRMLTDPGARSVSDARIIIPVQRLFLNMGMAMKKYCPAAVLVLMLLANGVCAADAKKGEKKEEKTASGIGITILKEGSGASPKAADVVKVHYRGTLTDGKEFDSSLKRGQPATFALNRVIPCWTEGVQTMKVGGKARLVCPPNLAYGSRGAPGAVPPDATLIFEVELLEILK